MIILGWVIFIFAMVTAAIVMRGWVLTVLWGWFIVPTFSLPELSIPAALGFTLIVSMFTQHLTNKKSESTGKTKSTLAGEIMGTAIGGPLVVLLLGWIIKSFM